MLSLDVLKEKLEAECKHSVCCNYDDERGFIVVHAYVDTEENVESCFTAISHYEFFHFKEYGHPFLIMPVVVPKAEEALPEIELHLKCPNDQMNNWEKSSDCIASNSISLRYEEEFALAA